MFISNYFFSLYRALYTKHNESTLRDSYLITTRAIQGFNGIRNTNYSLLNTNYSLLNTHYSILTTYYSINFIY